MAFSAFRDMKPGAQLIFAAFVIVVSFLVTMVLALVLAIPFYGLDAALNLTTMMDPTDPDSIKLMKYLQVVQSFGLFILPSLLLAYLYFGQVRDSLFMKKKISGASALMVLLMIITAGPFVNLINEWNTSMVFPDWMSGLENWMRTSEQKAEALTKAFLKVDGPGGLAFNLFMIALLPAIGEEFLFRGVIQGIFTRMTKNLHWGIWISAILFSAMHLQFYGFVPRMLLGVAFGYLLVWSGSIWLPVLAHFINNGMAVLVAYLVDHQQMTPEMEALGSQKESYYLAAISLGLIILFLRMIKKENQKDALSLPDYY